MPNLPVNRTIGVDLVGWRNPKSGRFDRMSQTARQRVRDLLTAQRDTLLRLAKAESPRSGTPPEGMPQRPADYVHFGDAWQAVPTDTPMGAEMVLENTSDHAGFVIFPTRAHPIALRHPDAGPPFYLRFYSQRDGEITFRKRVMHPGTKGNDVPGRVFEMVQPDLSIELGRVAVRVATDIRDVFAE